MARKRKEHIRFATIFAVLVILTIVFICMGPAIACMWALAIPCGLAALGVLIAWIFVGGETG